MAPNKCFQIYRRTFNVPWSRNGPVDPATEHASDNRSSISGNDKILSSGTGDLYLRAPYAFIDLLFIRRTRGDFIFIHFYIRARLIIALRVSAHVWQAFTGSEYSVTSPTTTVTLQPSWSVSVRHFGMPDHSRGHRPRASVLVYSADVACAPVH